MTGTDRSMIDKLLLSLIEPQLPAKLTRLSRQTERERRLRDLKGLLFGKKRTGKYIDDREALRYMARQYLRDHMVDVRNNPPAFAKKPRSIRTLAKEAVQYTGGNSNESTEERLRHLFTGKAKKEYLSAERDVDDVQESIQYQVLLQIKWLLLPFGVEMDPSVVIGHFAAGPKRSVKAVRRRT